MARNLLNGLPADGVTKEYLPKLFDSYPGLQGGDGVSSYLLWSESAKVKPFFTKNQVCHYQMPHVGAGYDNLITAVPRSDEASLAYLRMLSNGPFKALADLTSLEERDGNYYIRCSELDKWPANVLFNYCIATRVPIEFEKVITYWDKLVKVGYNPVLAYLLSQTTDGVPWAKVKSRSIDKPGHVWFSNTSNWKSIIKGDMTKMAPDFRHYPDGCRPADVIWGSITPYDDKGFYQLAKLSEEGVANLLDFPVEYPKPAPPPRMPRSKLDPFLDYAQGDAALANQMHINHIVAQAIGAQGNPAAEIAIPVDPIPAAPNDWIEMPVAMPAGDFVVHGQGHQAQPVGPPPQWVQVGPAGPNGEINFAPQFGPQQPPIAAVDIEDDFINFQNDWDIPDFEDDHDDE